MNSIHTSAGSRTVSIISEQGLYFFLGRSDKPKALPFQKWFAGEVLPSIRKTGAYIPAPAMRPALTTKQKREIQLRINELTNYWIFQKGFQGWLYNQLRVAFQVSRWEDIAAEHYGAVLALIESKKESTSAFVTFLSECRKWFEKECIGGGEPWTPLIRKRLTRELGRRVILPPRVDWLALADPPAPKKLPGAKKGNA